MTRPERLRPMLAAATDRLPVGDDWRFELKLDGYRIVAEAGDGPARLWSRGGHDYAARFPIVAERLSAAVRAPCALDGELCALDPAGRPRFQLLQSGTGRPAFFAFDILEREGRPVTDLALAERRRLLEATLGEDDVIRLSRVYGDGPGLLELARAQDLEGVMAKRAASRYRPGRRSQDWRKLKLRATGTFVVCGYLAGSGSRGPLGSLVLAEEADGGLRWVGEVGSGLSGPELDRLIAALRPLERAEPVLERTPRGRVTWVEPRLRARVDFAERTADGRLRAPVYAGLEAPARPSRRRRAPAVELTNVHKTFFPEDGITKGELIDYYRAVAPALVEHLRGRPFTMLRHPDGIHGKRFFQKDAPSHTPRWVHTSVRGGIRYVLVEDVPTLEWVVNLGCIDMHAWSARADRPDRPDWVLFDLDPADATPFREVVEVARLLRQALHGLDLESFPKTSGGKGLHVLVPIARRCDQDEVRAFAMAVARALERTAPELVTSAWRRSERHGVLVDVNQNGHGRTTAAVYSVRPRPGAPVSAPIGWDELAPALDPAGFTMAEVARRLRRRGDLYAPVLALRQRLPRL